MITFLGKCTGFSPTGVDARQEDDVELSSTRDGEIQPPVAIGVVVATFEVLLLAAVFTDKPPTAAVVTEDDEAVTLLVLAL